MTTPRSRRAGAAPAGVASGLVRRRSIGVDIGGTKVAAGVVSPTGEIIDSVRAETPDRSLSPLIIEQTIESVVRRLLVRHDARAVGIGAAGFVDVARSRVLFAPHLSWREEPLRDRMAERLGLPVVVENDANAAAWAEHRFGAGREEDHLVCITLGTGIGGAVLVDGTLLRGKYGVAGEFGHMQVVPGGHRCECGNRGCWEQYASGNALVRDGRELASAGSPMAHGLLDVAGGDPAQLTGPMVTAAARAGDVGAVELLAEVGHWLGVGLANLAAALDPGTFVIGGGVSDAGDLLLAPARQAFQRTLTGRGFRPQARIVLAELGSDAGLVGAADLARLESRRWVRRGFATRQRIPARRAGR